MLYVGYKSGFSTDIQPFTIKSCRHVGRNQDFNQDFYSILCFELNLMHLTIIIIKKQPIFLDNSLKNATFAENSSETILCRESTG